MTVLEDVKKVLGQTLRLGDKLEKIDAATPLFGSIPEFDSMAVVTVLTALEDRFGIAIEDDEIRADIFETVGSLTTFVERKLAA